MRGEQGPETDQSFTIQQVARLTGLSEYTLRSLAAELGIGDDLIFTGGISLAETVAFYRAADLLAYPSHNETSGRPILEAMACGCPVVTSQVSSMPEIAGGAAIPPIPPPSPRPW